MSSRAAIVASQTRACSETRRVEAGSLILQRKKSRVAIYAASEPKSFFSPPDMKPLFRTLIDKNVSKCAY